MAKKKVYKLTEAQALSLKGKEWDTDSYFNPIKDYDGNWFISKEEVRGLKKTGVEWIKDLPKIDYKSKDKDFKIDKE